MGGIFIVSVSILIMHYALIAAGACNDALLIKVGSGVRMKDSRNHGEGTSIWRTFPNCIQMFRTLTRNHTRGLINLFLAEHI